MTSRSGLRVFCLLLSGASLATGRTNPGVRERDVPAEESPSGPDRISPALEHAIQRGSGLDSVRIRVDWMRERRMTSAAIFGSGVGIWDGRVQFHLSREELLSALEAVRKARFGGMPARLGEEAEPLSIRGKMTVTIGQSTKGVVQLESGPQSEDLSALAETLLALSQRRAREGVSAESLSDALAKVAAGRLAPEVLELVLVRRKENMKDSEGEDGSMLRVEGREARAWVFRRGSGYGASHRLRLTDKDTLQLAALLRASDPADLPPNLYAAQYTDLRVEILQWSRDIQARRSLGVTPRTHGARQEAFDRMDQGLRRLAERVLQDGRTETGQEDDPGE